MMKRLGLTTIALSVLLLSGCGSSKKKSTDTNTSIDKNTTEQMKERDAIRIAHSYPDEACDSQIKSELARKGAKDIIISIEDNNVSCQTYGRINTDKGNCSESIYGGHENACVVGMNGISFDSDINISIAPDTLLEIL